MDAISMGGIVFVAVFLGIIMTTTEKVLGSFKAVFVKIVVRFFKVFAARTPCPVAAAYLG